MLLFDIDRELVSELRRLRFAPPVTCVYNPLEYAAEPRRLYLERYGKPPREIVLVGMNPGPFGMAQTGVPFGDPTMVRDWLGIEAPVQKPPCEHPKRPIDGFACHRSEVSGERLWGWARDTFGTPASFFRRFFVANYCPLAFLEESGRNRTPDKLPAEEREQLFAIRDRGLRGQIELLEPKLVIGVGNFAAERARIALAGMNLEIGRVPHPSPASPAANRGWGKLVSASLRSLGVEL